MSSEPANWVGLRLENDRYNVLARLGTGGMGTVYHAQDTKLDCHVVLKAPRRALLESAQSAERFRREIRALVNLSHPHIVRVQDVGEYEGLPFFVMRYLSGGSLQDRLRVGADGRSVPMPASQLHSWLPDVADALDSMHRQGYLHRDVKPHNILFDADGKAYLSDFGLARAVEGLSPDRNAALTSTGQLMGTLLYVAPEICQEKAYDGRVDQYALAATAYHYLCGRPPFEGPPAVVLALHLTQPPPAPRQFVPGLPDATSAALLRGLAKEPERRFPDCRSLARAVLAPVPGGRSTTAVTAVPASQAPADAGPIRLTCPSCGKVYRAPAAAAGKKVKCPVCKVILATPAAEPAAASAPTAESPRGAPADNFRRRLLWAAAAGGAAAAVLLFVAWALWSVFGGQGPSVVLQTEPVTVEPGSRRTVRVPVVRRDWNGPFRIESEGLPEGVRVNQVEVPEGADVADLIVSAAADARPASLEVRLFAVVDGRRSESKLSVTVAPRSQNASVVNAIGMQLVLVRKNTFTMGAPVIEERAEDDERPQHDVTFTRSYYVGRFEVTQQEYQKVVGSNPSYFQHGRPGADKLQGIADTGRFPVESVTWPKAQAFCRLLSELPDEKRAGRVYRLPTEAEWEYACRARPAGYPKPFAFGDSLSSDLANFDGNRPFGGAPPGKRLGRTERVGAYQQANGFGLYDTHGNVWEWCEDGYDQHYYERCAPSVIAPKGPEAATGGRRVLRGGGWNNPSWDCRSARRFSYPGDDSQNDVGFRVVADAPE